MHLSSDILTRIQQLTPFPASYLPYNESLFAHLRRAYDVAARARRTGCDPTPFVEAELAFDLADRVDHLLRFPVAPRLRELLAQYRTEQAALLLAEEIALGKFGFLSKEEALDVAVRVGLAVVTEGVTVAPLQGISSVRLKKNDDGGSYVAVVFAGPIRSAGGTEAAFTLVIADHVRRALGLGNYRLGAWGEDEVGRFVEELRTYEREVGNFQFRVADEDVQYALLHLPVEIDGVETDPVEVVVHRGLRRIDTDRVRGGALRVLNDGIVGRARKLLKLVEELHVHGWEWLAELQSGRQQSAEETAPAGSHFEEVISGRPVLSLPGRMGGFRLRYGRSYATGLSAVGVHPAAAALLDHPFVVGTQVKVDMPGKAGTITFVDSIEPPVVRLADGSVVRVENVEYAVRLRGSIDKVLYLGDLLVSFGDFLENNMRLQPSGYVEEWWWQEFIAAVTARYASVQTCAQDVGLDVDRLQVLMEDYRAAPSVTEAFLLSEKLGLPLHPRYLFFWDVASAADVLTLRQQLVVGSPQVERCLLTAPNRPEVKGVLEKVGVPHRVDNDRLLLEGEVAYAVMRTLGLLEEREVLAGWKDMPELLSNLAGIPIRGKASAFIGLRMGRPEKAMPRRMKPPVHVLFPVGVKGGASRDILEAAGQGESLEVELISLICSKCGSHSFTTKCVSCGGDTQLVKRCPRCGGVVEAGMCPVCKLAGVPYARVQVPIRQALRQAMARVNYNPPAPLKGVRGLTNATRVCEPLEKGILRRKYDLSIYKDGTIRFDVTNVPLTHFAPVQLGATAERLRQLGYEHDIHGRPLESDDQLLELRTQDVILPVEAGEYLTQGAKFVDELLVHLYGESAYYNVNTKDDLVGHLVMGLAPHTSVAVVGRVIGFTHAQVCFAHPYWHSAKRRDCDGDQDAVMLLLDVLLNFSRDFLPAQVGGLMDAPLLIQPILLPQEVQRQAHNFDVGWRYPLAFYEGCRKRPPPHEMVGVVEVVRDRLKDERQFSGFGFTHASSVLAGSRARSSYAVLRSLAEKLDRQIELASKIAAVDVDVVMASVLRTHLLPDVLGNLRAYTGQSFRCKACGAVFRRPPLKGVCLACGGDLLPAVSRASVEKYLALGRRLCQRFNMGDYLRRRLELAGEELALLFPARKEGVQLELTDFLDA